MGHGRYFSLSISLRLHASLVPVDDVHQLPGILAKFKLELAIFPDSQLTRGIENACALVLVGVVQIKLAGGQAVRLALRVVIGFTESDQPVGGEPYLATAWEYESGGYKPGRSRVCR